MPPRPKSDPCRTNPRSQESRVKEFGDFLSSGGISSLRHTQFMKYESGYLVVRPKAILICEGRILLDKRKPSNFSTQGFLPLHEL